MNPPEPQTSSPGSISLMSWAPEMSIAQFVGVWLGNDS